MYPLLILGTALIAVGAAPYAPQNSGRSGAIEWTDASTLRFSVLPGDVWYHDIGRGVERSEIAGQTNYVTGKPIIISYAFTVEPGPADTAPWTVLGQFHGLDSNPPAFAIELDAGEHMLVAGSAGHILWRDSAPIIRGHAYHMWMQINFSPDGTGYANVYRDGTKIVAYVGPLGYGTPVYWKEGAYLESTTLALAADYSGLSIRQ